MARRFHTSNLGVQANWMFIRFTGFTRLSFILLHGLEMDVPIRFAFDNFLVVRSRAFLTLSLSKSAKFKADENILNFILQNRQKQTVPHEGTAQ